jgi:hypothetical protein
MKIAADICVYTNPSSAIQPSAADGGPEASVLF